MVNRFAMRSTGDMQADWDARAVEDYRFYIDTCHYESEDDFDRNGIKDVAYLVNPVYNSISHDHLLEIGCGAGRMTKHLSKNFNKVIATDVSEEMLHFAARRLANPESNVTLMHTNGITLPDVEDEWSDFTLCFAVLDHIPERSYVTGLLMEIRRTLNPLGMAVLEIGGCGLGKNDIDSHAGTWNGIKWTPGGFERFLEKVGFTVEVVNTLGNPVMIYYARRSR